MWPGDYLASLQRLEPLEVEDVLPAHEHAFKDLRGRLREIVEHHERRLDEMLAIIGDGRARSISSEALMLRQLPPRHTANDSSRNARTFDRTRAVSEPSPREVPAAHRLHRPRRDIGTIVRSRSAAFKRETKPVVSRAAVTDNAPGSEGCVAVRLLWFGRWNAGA